MRRTGGTREREKEMTKRRTQIENCSKDFIGFFGVSVFCLFRCCRRLCLFRFLFFSFNAIIMMNRDPFALTHITSHMRQGPFTQKITVEWMFFFFFFVFFVYLFIYLITVVRMIYIRRPSHSVGLLYALSRCISFSFIFYFY